MGQGLKVPPTVNLAKLLTKVALTKADRVQKSDHKYWLDKIKKDTAKKYFLTMLHAPNTPESERTWENDRVEEKKVLLNKPWNDVDMAQRGISNLTETLSKILAQMIKARLFNSIDDN